MMSWIEERHRRVLQPWIARDANEIRALAFCIPHAGGGAAAARPLAAAASPYLGVVGVRLPGRESRFSEPMPDSIDEIGRALADEIELATELLNLPFVIVGQCAGSALAYVLALELQKRGQARFKGCVMASVAAPSEVLADPVFSSVLSRETVFAEFLRRGGIPAEIAADAEAAAMFGDVLFNDIRMLKTFKQKTEVLNSPLIVIKGSRDRVIESSAWRGWEIAANPPVGYREVDGGHFLFAEAPAAVIGAAEDLLCAEYCTPSIRERQMPANCSTSSK